MTNTPEETARRFEQQAQVQREQFEMIRAQQESIDTLKQMLHNCLKIRGSQPTKPPLKSLKANEKKEKAHLLYISRRKSNLLLSHLNPHLRGEATRTMEGFILKE